MHLTKDKIDTFFDTYARRFNDALTGETYDVEGTASAFAECFVEASPLGVNCGKNDEEFRESIPKGFAYYKSIGTRGMNIVSKEVIPIDDYHAMVKVHWMATYLKKNREEVNIGFDVFYLLQGLGEQIRIFAYITGDEQKVMQEYGLIG